LDLFARIVALGKIRERRSLRPGASGLEGKWVPMDHSKSKKHEGIAVLLAAASNCLKKSKNCCI